jgi:hypothetical protein
MFVELAIPHSRTGQINLSGVIKFFYFVLVGSHYFICIWMWIGNKNLLGDPNTPWMLSHPELGSGGELYTFILYWIFTIITTVGYGDFTGGTTGEYLVTIAIEFVGIICFTVLISLVNQLAESSLTYEKLIFDKFTELEEWIIKIEQCN